MKQAKSNTKILRQSVNNNNNKKTNIFIKSAANHNFNTIKTTNSKNKKNYLISLLGRKVANNLNLNKFGLNSKKNNNKKEIYLTNVFGNINNKKENNKNRPFQRNINIRLNLNNEIINNNFGNYCLSTKNQNIHKSMSNINLNEKIKEKDKLITKLQTELLQLQEFLNELQKDKQNELFSTYNSMKSLDIPEHEFNSNKSLTALLNVPSKLKFNKNNQKIRKYLYMNKSIPYHIHSGFNTTKVNTKSKHNFIRSFSSNSSPRMVLPHKLDNVEFYNNNFPIKNFNRKKEKNLRINYNSNPNISYKKNYKFPSPKSFCYRQLSYTNINSDNVINDNHKNNHIENNIFIEKCEKLKKRTKILLNRYNLIINELNHKTK